MKKLSRNLILALFLLIFLVFLPSISMAVPAAPDVSQVQQPDGTKIEVLLGGDEWFNWVETVKGYTISQDENGYWYYVLEYDGRLPILDSTYAHEAPPDGLQKHIRPEVEKSLIPPTIERGTHTPLGRQHKDSMDQMEPLTEIPCLF